MAGAAGGASACSTRSWPCSANFLRLTPLYARGRRNALDLKLVELESAFADLPGAFDGIRILHVSDTHLDVFPEGAGATSTLLTGPE